MCSMTDCEACGSGLSTELSARSLWLAIMEPHNARRTSDNCKSKCNCSSLQNSKKERIFVSSFLMLSSIVYMINIFLDRNDFLFGYKMFMLFFCSFPLVSSSFWDHRRWWHSILHTRELGTYLCLITLARKDTKCIFFFWGRGVGFESCPFQTH